METSETSPRHSTPAPRAPRFWRPVLLTLMALLAALGCSFAGEQRTPPVAAVPIESPSPTPRPTVTVTATAMAIPLRNEPIGFPVNLSVRPQPVVETAQGRAIAPAAENGPTVAEVTRIQAQAENNWEANQYGWNCRVHQQYEGAPAVDWYLPQGTPVLATMQGQAELYVITTANAYRYYGVDPRVSLGLPPPAAPLYPLPDVGGGMGIFVSILNGGLRAEYGHLDLAPTLLTVPDSAFRAPYSKIFDYAATFKRPVAHTQTTLVARWTVALGEVVGYVGNTGYSEVPHLHYQIVTQDRQTKYCPTTEAFPNAGWLFGRPGGLP